MSRAKASLASSQLATIIAEHLDIIGPDPDSHIPGLQTRINIAEIEAAPR